MSRLPGFPGPSLGPFSDRLLQQSGDLRVRSASLELGAADRMRQLRQRLVSVMKAGIERRERKREEEKARNKTRDLQIGAGVGALAGGAIGLAAAPAAVSPAAATGVGLTATGAVASQAALGSALTGATIGTGVGSSLAGGDVQGALDSFVTSEYFSGQ